MSSETPSVEFLPDQPSLWFFGLSLVGLCLIFRRLAPYFPTTKQKSWVLTTVCSAVMTTASIPFVWDYLSNGASVNSVRTTSALALPASRFFQAHLVADLFMGALYYSDHVELLTGWIHHIVYMFIVEMGIRWSWAHIFCLCAFMELPTFILASATLFPRLRSNILFAVSFFVTRIMLHIVLCISYLLPHNRASTTGGSYIPSTILSLIFPLHAFWFHGCIKGFTKRANAKAVFAPTLPPLAIPPENLTASTNTDPTVVHQTSMVVPGSFSLPPLRLRLGSQRLSPKHRKRRSLRDTFGGAGNDLRTRSLERT